MFLHFNRTKYRLLLEHKYEFIGCLRSQGGTGGGGWSTEGWLGPPGDFYCWPSQGGSSAFGSLVILDVALCCLCLFTLYIYIKIGKNSC